VLAAPLPELRLALILELEPLGRAGLPPPSSVPVLGVVVVLLPPPLAVLPPLPVPPPPLLVPPEPLLPLPPELPPLPPVSPEPALGEPLAPDPEPPCEPLGAGLVEGGATVCPPPLSPEELGACGRGLLGAVNTGAAPGWPPYELVVGAGPSGNR
jgi:hypothetical protein